MDLLFCGIERQVPDIKSRRILQGVFFFLWRFVISVIIGVPSIVVPVMLLL